MFTIREQGTFGGDRKKNICFGGDTAVLVVENDGEKKKKKWQKQRTFGGEQMFTVLVVTRPVFTVLVVTKKNRSEKNRQPHRINVQAAVHGPAFI